MSISVNLYYTGKNGSARKFAEEMESGGTANLIRGEEGCERYEYFLPLNDPETVLLIDVWKDQGCIDMHHASEMMKTVAELREKYGLRMRAERYITDKCGMPAEDMKFIKKK